MHLLPKCLLHLQVCQLLTQSYLMFLQLWLRVIQQKMVLESVGFSGHHLGIAADIAAIALGATWVERHFTLDRTCKGTDHAASLEADGLRKLVRDVRNVSKALKYKETELLPVELETRKKLKWHTGSASAS